MSKNAVWRLVFMALVILVLIVLVLVSLAYPKSQTEEGDVIIYLSPPAPCPSYSSSSNSLPPISSQQNYNNNNNNNNSNDGDNNQGEPNLQYEFYRDRCPQAENIVRSTMAQIFAHNNNSTAQILRLFFHDCFIQGCDASVFLEDRNGTHNHLIEKDAIPNKTLKGFNFVDAIKQELEEACPGIVSCADILVLATRDAIVLAGGPFYPVITGRRDSNTSYFAEALAEIPKPDGNISETLRLFALRGFSEKETVALLGGHNIGKIGCEFIEPRLHNFQGTGHPDPTMPFGFLDEISQMCGDIETISPNVAPSPMRRSRSMAESVIAIKYHRRLSSSISSGSAFGPKYFQSLLKGRGLLFADQQLMVSKRTAQLVRAYASDDGTTFRIDFARAMLKMSNFGVLTGSQGQVRLNCSRLVNSH